jgi:hypothetical protein
MGRFDPREGEPYGKCVTCGITLQTNRDGVEHRAATRPAGVGKSHATQATNPDRESRIQRHVDSAVESAISDALDDLQGDVDRGDVTEAEIAEALRWHTDFHKEWKAGN